MKPVCRSACRCVLCGTEGWCPLCVDVVSASPSPGLAVSPFAWSRCVPPRLVSPCLHLVSLSPGEVCFKLLMRLENKTNERQRGVVCWLVGGREADDEKLLLLD